MAEAPLYHPSFDHDACGVGLVADLTGTPTHRTIEDALRVLEQLEHRGATGADPLTGDGAGLMCTLPDALLRDEATALSIELPPPGAYGVVVWFLAGATASQDQSALDREMSVGGLRPLGWRAVPVDPTVPGPGAAATAPQQWMQLLGGGGRSGVALDNALYTARRRASAVVGTYAASSSSRAVVYKGMLTSRQLRPYFADLRDPRTAATVALVHGRFSTNTFPAWPLAQPFRLIAHNGEFNTIRSNRHWMRAREPHLSSSELVDLDAARVPILTPGVSDSANFDEAVELLHRAGRSLPHAMLMLVPEPWERATTMPTARRDFYRYHASLVEPWDGPAALAFTDGEIAGAVLDRNGLRPLRYCVTKDRRVVVASEVGVLELDPSDVTAKGRLQPGRLLLIDTVKGRLVDDGTLKDELSKAHPYGQWLAEHQLDLDALAEPAALVPTHGDLAARQRLFDYTDEDLRLILRPMAQSGEEPISSMGADTPLAPLSAFRRSVFDYLSQGFAQVTNPPLDAIREELVTSTRLTIGGEGNLLHAVPTAARQIAVSSPVLSASELAKLRYVHEASAGRFRATVLDGSFDATTTTPGDTLVAALDDLEARAIEAARSGSDVLILSDRDASPDRVPLPSLLMVAAVHHRLVAERLRSSVGLVAEAGDAREVHHIAALLGFGASAVAPYLAYETVDALVARGEVAAIAPAEARYRYAKALTKGLVKVMSKMGVSTVASYIGSQLFEAVGLADEVHARCFPDLPARIGGTTFAGLAEDLLARHHRAYGAPAATPLMAVGDYQWRRDGELHLFNPRTVFKLQHATRATRYDLFREYTALVDRQSAHPVTLRGQLAFAPAGLPLPLESVEPVAEIVRRFATGAMSYGSISAEAHETLAVAMNRLGGKSNTGEGGEDPARYESADPEWDRRSAIKQVASARFGVTLEYLLSADDLQIKIAQGAKPGEGGQLPGAKVYPWIAATRHATPGVGLVSPPPHHDIYSIEDLAQLIYDLKAANDAARVHVKLVAGAGIGTIAAGVAKAGADVILISGHDGGTGAAPLTSLRHAGSPWEIGLAEVQQTLAASGLRDAVVLQVDGQLKTGRDVVVAALLGAEEFGFATAPLVVSGCVMMRVCHLDTCPVGIATQNPVLRERFTGRPEFVEQFFEFLAQEVREHLAELGLDSLAAATGRTELLRATMPQHPRSALALDRLLAPALANQRRSRRSRPRPAPAFDAALVEDALATARAGAPYRYVGPVANTDRAVGTTLGARLVRALGTGALAEDQVTLELSGTAGQSLGAFLPAGVTVRLTGDANDYVGKGLSGGRVIVRPPHDRAFPTTSVVAGNVCGYGATAGDLFLEGVVGERLAVRNSGATVIAEGVGDHACEYMTGGVAVLLGPTGRNLAAGMTGGTLYVLDPDRRVDDALADGDFDVDLLDGGSDARLVALLHRYHAATGSARAAAVVGEWRQWRMAFLRIESREYQRALAAHG